MIKKILKTVILLSSFFVLISIAMLLYFLFSKSFNILCVRIMLSLLYSLSCIFLVGWNLYIHSVEYKCFERYQKENGCYKTVKPMREVEGIAIFCTETNDMYLNTYVDFPEELGVNEEGTNWNNTLDLKMPHEFIGLDRNGDIVVVNTLPHKFGCFFKESTCEINPNSIKIYVCKASHQQNSEYFIKAVQGALVNICNILCNKYKIKPDKILCDNLCSEWFMQNEYSDAQLQFDVKARNKPIMLFYDDYQKLKSRFSKRNNK